MADEKNNQSPAENPARAAQTPPRGAPLRRPPARQDAAIRETLRKADERAAAKMKAAAENAPAAQSARPPQAPAPRVKGRPAPAGEGAPAKEAPAARTGEKAAAKASAKSTRAAEQREKAAAKARAAKPKQDPEQVRLRKEEQNRAARRRNRQLIGLALCILIVAGAVSIIRGGVNVVRGWLDDSDLLGVYEERFAPLVWFDILPFESITQVDENTVKEVAIWGILNEKGDSVTRNENGEALITALEVDQYGTSLLGPGFRFSGHGTFRMREDLTYVYDEAAGQYAAPVTGLLPEYLPRVVDIVRESGGVRRVVVGYVSTRTSDNQVIATPDYDHPLHYMDFMLRRDGNEYYLYAIQRNTTYTPPPASGASGSSSSSLAPPSSSSVASTVPAGTSAGDVPAGSSAAGDVSSSAPAQDAPPASESAAAGSSPSGPASGAA